MMKNKLLATLIIALFSQLTCANGLLELRGRFWEVVSFDIKGTQSKRFDLDYSGSCDHVAMKESSYNNYNEFGGDDAIILDNDIVCAKDPVFNVLGVTPDRSAPEDTVKVAIALGEGRLGGLFSGKIPEDEQFKLVDRVTLTMKCSLEYRPFYSFSYAYVNCEDEKTGSKVRLLAH